MEFIPLDMKIALASVFVQVALTFYAVITMGLVRVRTIRQFDLNLADIALDSKVYPDEAQKHANNLTNQFEFPVLLYMAVTLATVFDASSMFFGVACALFVVTRVYHRFVHVNSNNVRTRFKIFLIGLGFLGLAWVLLGLRMIEFI